MGNWIKREPDFFCIGFQKSGTTTLFEILRQHKGVVLARDVKESMYYRTSFMRFFFGKRYYLRRYFAHIKAGDTRLAGEVNAGLTYNRCAGMLAKDFSPSAKLIFMMRDPIERSFSAYKYFLARGFLPANAIREDKKYGHAAAFDRYVHRILDSPKERGQIMKKRLKYLIFSQSNYGHCLQEYAALFPKENMRFIVFEEFLNNMGGHCKEVFQFLGIEDDKDIDYHIHANEGNECSASPFWAKEMQIMKAVQYLLCEFAAFDLWNKPGSRLIRKIYREMRKRGMQDDTDHSKILPATREYLRNYFLPEVELASEITGIDLREAWPEFRR